MLNEDRELSMEDLENVSGGKLRNSMKTTIEKYIYNHGDRMNRWEMAVYLCDMEFHDTKREDIIKYVVENWDRVRREGFKEYN